MPLAVSGADAPVLYTVMLSDGAAALLQPVVGATPTLRADVPCLVRDWGAPEELSVEAFARTAHDGGLVLRLDPLDTRRHERFDRVVPITLEAPGTGIVTGTTEDLSVGGVRARLCSAPPAARRVFVTLLPAGSPPIVASARVVSSEPSDDERWWTTRLEFTSIAPLDQARLWVLVDLPAGAETA